MPRYRCHYLDPEGRSGDEIVEGETPHMVSFVLRERGLRVCSVDELDKKPPKSRRAPLTAAEVTSFNDVMKAVAKTGSIYPESIIEAARSIGSSRVQSSIESFSASLEQGTSMSDALSEAQPSLPDLYVGMIRAGESAENLPAVLDHFGEYAARNALLRRRIAGALTYPLMSATLVFIIFLFLCIFIAPVLRDMFLQLGSQPPAATQVMYRAGEIFGNPAFAAGALTAAVLIAVYWRWGKILIPAPARTPLAEAAESVMSVLPVIGNCRRLYNTAQFCQSMAGMLKHGAPLPESLSLAVGATGSARLARRRAVLEQAVRDGDTLPEALARTRAFSSQLMWMLNAGWDHGEMVEALEEVGALAERDFDTASFQATRIVTPTALAILGLFVLFTVIGTLLAYFDLTSIVF